MTAWWPPVRRRCLVATACAALIITVAGFVGPGTGFGQEEAPEGRLSGTIVSGTEGVEPGEVDVRVIILEDGQVTGDELVTTEDGSFEFTVPADPARTYIVTARYQGVQYFDPVGPVRLTPDEPEATRDLTVYEATDETPDLRIVDTVVALAGIDPARGEILFQREDFIEVPGDRVFTGDETGITLRIPVPEGTTRAEGGELQGGVVSTDTELHPGENSIVTQYLVQYDPADDEYLLRVIAPVPTERITLRVPDGAVQRLEPREGARRGEDYTAPELEDLVMQTVVLDTPSDPGRGLLVDLVGLSGARTSHPLTERPGSIIATGLALALISGAMVVGLRRRNGSDA